MRLGEIIRQRRKELGLTEAALARLVSVNQGYLSRVETGQVRPGADFCAQVSRALGLKLPAIYGEDLETVANEIPAEDLVAEIRATLIRGRWPKSIREGVLSIIRETQPDEDQRQNGSDARHNAKKAFLLGIH